MDAHCLIFEGSSKNEEQKPEFFTLYKEFEARVSEALEEFVTSQFDDDGTRRERMDELSADEVLHLLDVLDVGLVEVVEITT